MERRPVSSDDACPERPIRDDDSSPVSDARLESANSSRGSLLHRVVSLVVAALLLVALLVFLPRSCAVSGGVSKSFDNLLFNVLGVEITAEEPARHRTAALVDLVYDQVASFERSCDGLARYGYTVGQFKAAIEQVQADPYYDYLGSYEYTYRNDAASPDDCTLESFTLDYRIDVTEQGTYDAIMDAAVARALTTVPQDASDYEKALAAHDYLVRTCVFDEENAAASHTAYGALVVGRATNRGYADAYALLLDRMGLSAVLVQDSQTGIPWNLVCVDGSWYHVDVAWDDPVPDAGADVQPNHRYFLRGDALMAAEHAGWEPAYEAFHDYAAAFVGETSAERVAYARELWREAIVAGSTEVTGLDMLGITVGEAYAAYDELMTDPLYAYVASRGVSYYEDADTFEACTVSSMTLEYRLDAEQIARYWIEVEDCIAEALSWAEGAQTDYEKALAIHDYLVRTCAYDELERPSSYTIYGALVEGQAVCQGYSDAFKVLLDRLGIPCEVVSSIEMAHGWNIVQVDGAWYHVDVTWDDPAPDRGFDAEVSYLYFLRSDDAMYALGHWGWETELSAPNDYGA